MKVITSIIFLCFFLLGGGHHSNATNFHSPISYSSTQNFSNNRHVKITNESNNFILIEESDIDLEEEFARDNDIKSINDCKFILTNYRLLNKWYSLFCNQKIVAYKTNYFKTESFLYDQSTPIYLIQRVLRI